MYSAVSRQLGLASRCRLTKRPRAFSVTTCGKFSKRNSPSSRKSRRKTRENDRQPAEAADDKKLRKGCVVVAENADGTVLFNFEPNLGNQQLSSGLTVLSTGQQQHTHLKLSKVAEGSANNQLTYRLWHSTASSAPTSASTSNNQHSSHGSDVGTQNVGRATSQPSEGQPSGQQPPKQQPRAKERSNGSTDGTLSLLLDLQPSSDRREQADIPEYSFAVTQGSPPGPSDSAQRPSLMQKPVRPPVTEQPPPPPYTESRFEKKEERWVPCYLWHESGLPKTADLRDFPYEFHDNSENSEDTVTSSDAPAPLVDSDSQVRQHQAQAAAPTGLVQQAWRHIHYLLLRIWRLLPYWFRSKLQGSQQRQPPAVHASRIVAQHTMAVIRTQAVEGSTYDLESGRSPTPLADVERHQVEDLIQMGVKNLELFQTALTAPSAITKDRTIAASFDRLEYLGDAAVALAFRNWVYDRFPEDDEGSMTNTANTLVSNRAHVLYANHLHLSRYIAQNLQHQRPNQRADEEVLADAFEALVGAIYLDSGIEAASRFVIGLAAEVMGLETDLSSYRNYKLYLVNSVNQKELGRVTYQSKKRGANLWQSKCRLQGKLVGLGLDKQRKQAESAAAYAAMEHLGFKDFNMDPVGFRPSRHADRKPYFKPMSEQTPNQAASVPAAKSSTHRNQS